jgi:hypothetical protein
LPLVVRARVPGRTIASASSVTSWAAAPALDLHHHDRPFGLVPQDAEGGGGDHRGMAVLGGPFQTLRRDATAAEIQDVPRKVF